MHDSDYDSDSVSDSDSDDEDEDEDVHVNIFETSFKRPLRDIFRNSPTYHVNDLQVSYPELRVFNRDIINDNNLMTSVYLQSLLSMSLLIFLLSIFNAKTIQSLRILEVFLFRCMIIRGLSYY